MKELLHKQKLFYYFRTLYMRIYEHMGVRARHFVVVCIADARLITNAYPVALNRCRLQPLRIKFYTIDSFQTVWLQDKGILTNKPLIILVFFGYHSNV